MLNFSNETDSLSNITSIANIINNNIEDLLSEMYYSTPVLIKCTFSSKPSPQ